MSSILCVWISDGSDQASCSWSSPRDQTTYPWGDAGRRGVQFFCLKPAVSSQAFAPSWRAGPWSPIQRTRPDHPPLRFVGCWQVIDTLGPYFSVSRTSTRFTNPVGTWSECVFGTRVSPISMSSRVSLIDVVPILPAWFCSLSWTTSPWNLCRDDWFESTPISF